MALPLRIETCKQDQHFLSLGYSPTEHVVSHLGYQPLQEIVAFQTAYSRNVPSEVPNLSHPLLDI